MKIDDNYKANKDTYGWTMTFSEERERIKNDGSKEGYLYEEHTYHASLKQCLKRYLDISLKDVPSVKEILGRIDEVEDKIDGLKM